MLIMFENVTYFFSSQTAYFWLAMPLYMTLAPTGTPHTYDPVTFTAGGLWIELNLAILYGYIFAWAPLENNKAPEKQSLLKTQQMFFMTAPLHTLAILQGVREGLLILFGRKDASRWSSFDQIHAIILAKVWAIVMMFGLSTSVVVGTVRVFTDGGIGNLSSNYERLLGVVMSLVFLCLTYPPAFAMFFHERAIAARKNPSRLDHCTAAVFGKAATITPALFYTFLYASVIVVALAGFGSSEKHRSSL